MTPISSRVSSSQVFSTGRKGIAIAKAQGRYTGRKSIDVPDLEKVVRLWREGWMTAVEAMRRLELSPSTFYRKVKQVR